MKKLLVGLTAAAVFAPLFTSALTANDIQGRGRGSIPRIRTQMKQGVFYASGSEKICIKLFLTCIF